MRSSPNRYFPSIFYFYFLCIHISLGDLPSYYRVSLMTLGAYKLRSIGSESSLRRGAAIEPAMLVPSFARFSLGRSLPQGKQSIQIEVKEGLLAKHSSRD